MSDSVRPQRRQPTRLPCPWDSQGKNTGVGCHFLLQCMTKVKVKSFSRVRLSATPWTVAHQAPPSMGFSRQEYWSGVPLPSPSPLITHLVLPAWFLLYICLYFCFVNKIIYTSFFRVHKYTLIYDICFSLISLCFLMCLLLKSRRKGSLTRIRRSNSRQGASQVALVVKNPPVSAGNIRDTGLIPRFGGSPREGNGNPLQYP